MACPPARLVTAARAAGPHGAAMARRTVATASMHIRGPREPVVPYPLTPKRVVPPHIPTPPYVRLGAAYRGSSILRPEIKTQKQIDTMRRGAAIASRVRAFAGSLVKPGVTPDDIDAAVHDKLIGLGAYPSPLGFPFNGRLFPKSVCSSVNEVIVHGIPDTRPLREGDMVTLDVSCFVDGYHGDCAGTFIAGKGSHAAVKLAKAAKDAVNLAVSRCGPGVRFSVIGSAVAEVAAAGNYGLVTNFFGHGIGRDMHQPPMVAHFPNDMEDEMRPGMVFTIEPMLTEGAPDNHMWEDGWSVAANDGGLSAQHEEMVAIHLDGRVEVLTKTYPDGWNTAWGPIEPL